MVQINMSIPESCAECRLSVRHFGKLYCPPLNDRVGNEDKDSRCPLVDAEGGGDLISKKQAIDAIRKDVMGGLNYEGIISELPSVTIKDTSDEIKVTNCNHLADVGKKVSISRDHENGKDTIYRQDAIDAINTWDKFGVDERGRLVRWHEGLELYVHLRDVLTAIVNLPSAQPEQEDYTELKQEFLRMASYIDVLLECSDEQKETLIGFISRLAEFMPWTERD